MVISNFVNFMAVARAWRLFIRCISYGQAPRVGQDGARLPERRRLGNTRQDLGDLLCRGRRSTRPGSKTRFARTRARGAARARAGGARLARRETLAEAVAFQADLPRGRFDPALVRGAGRHRARRAGAHARAAARHRRRRPRGVRRREPARRRRARRLRVATWPRGQGAHRARERSGRRLADRARRDAP